MLKHLKTSDDFADKGLVQKGFTLIELLVVIIILGILAAVVIFAIGNTRENAQEASCRTELKTVKTAVAAWKTDNSGEPGTADLVPDYLEETPENHSVSGGVVTAINDCA